MVNVDDLSGVPRFVLAEAVPFLGCVLALLVFAAPIFTVMQVCEYE